MDLLCIVTVFAYIGIVGSNLLIGWMHRRRRKALENLRQGSGDPDRM